MTQDGSARVLIAGAGIGGLTLALALLRRGLDVQVLEQATTLGEVGAGVQLSPNATRCLYSLGLQDALESVACVPDGTQVRGARGSAGGCLTLVRRPCRATDFPISWRTDPTSTRC